jgi:hypothetical protein
MFETGSLPSDQETLECPSDSAAKSRCLVLTPPARIAALWEGALRARLNREPLDDFLRNHSQQCLDQYSDPLLERLELACLFIIDPVLPHSVDWRPLCQVEYFLGLARAIAQISWGLAYVVQEPTLWRVAALRAMGHLLMPIMGIDTAASLTAASMAPFRLSRACWPAIDDTLENLTVETISNRSEATLIAARLFVRELLTSAAESGAATEMTAPLITMILAEPPSNH